MSTLYYLGIMCIIALLAAFIILFISKVGLRNYIIAKAPHKIISDLFECDFCLGFWLGVVLAIIFVAFTGNGFILTCPFLSTVLTRILV